MRYAQAGAIAAFTAKILHGDEDHRAWLHEACEAFIAGEDMPAPRGKGRTEAQRDGAIAEAVILRRALQECQNVLDNLVRPTNTVVGGVESQTAWAQCVEAERHARTALSASPRAAAVADLRTATVNLISAIVSGTVYEDSEPSYYNGPIRAIFDEIEKIQDALAALDGET